MSDRYQGMSPCDIKVTYADGSVDTLHAVDRHDCNPDVGALLMRRALLDLDAELWFSPRDDAWRDSLARTIDALEVFGLTITGSMTSPRSGVVRLVLQGKSLPAECDQDWRVVSPTLTEEAHGRQRIVRITDLRVVSKSPFD